MSDIVERLRRPITHVSRHEDWKAALAERPWAADEIERLGNIAHTRAEHILELQAEIERLQNLLNTGNGVIGKTLANAAKVRTATIEECALMAEAYGNGQSDASIQIAAAIRALAESTSAT